VKRTTAVALGPSLAIALDFDEFCRGEYRSVLGLALVLCGDAGVAEDLTQEAFFAAYRSWSRIGLFENPGAWVRRVVANRAVSQRRRWQVEVVALQRLRGRRVPEVELPERDASLWELVRRLPRRQAQAFALTHLDGLSTDEVGAVLGISPGTVKTHLARARAALAASIGAVEGTGADAPDGMDEGRGHGPQR
jgi:RNA polymerase sigma-70 factor (ECF subfamily)